MATSTASPLINPLRRLPDVKEATGKSRSTIYRDIKRGLFTKPVSIGGDRSAWPQNEIEAINKARIAGKSDDEIKKLVEQLHTERVAQYQSKNSTFDGVAAQGGKNA